MFPTATGGEVALMALFKANRQWKENWDLFLRLTFDAKEKEIGRSGDQDGEQTQSVQESI